MRAVLSLLHLSVLLALCATRLNAYVPPHIFGALNLLSLAFPVLLVVHIFLTLGWIVMLKKRALLFALASLLLVQPARTWVNFAEKQSPGKIKILTLNGKYASFGAEKIRDLIRKENPDIAIFQEMITEDIKGYKKITYSAVSMVSRHNIIHHENIISGGNNSEAMYADVDVNGHTVRIFNIYLEPFYFDKKMIRPGENSAENEKKAKNVVSKLIKTFKVHETQVNTLKEMINDSPYPVIAGGDFNAVPNSYEYYQIADNLRDGFVETGRGSATSFHDYKFPLRIDYLFSSGNIQPRTYRVDRSVRLSDHFPVIATFDVQ